MKVTINNKRMTKRQFMHAAKNDIAIARHALNDKSCIQLISGPAYLQDLLYLALRHEEIADTIMRDETIWKALCPSKIFELSKKFRSISLLLHHNSYVEIKKSIRAYKKLKNYTNGSKFAPRHSAKKILKLVQAANISPTALAKIAFLRKDPTIGLYILQNKHVWMHFAETPGILLALAKMHAKAAKAAVEDQDLIQLFNGRALLKITEKHDIYLRNQSAQKKLFAEIFPENLDNHHITKKQYFQAALHYHQSVVKTNSAALGYCFRAAFLGHKLALQELIKYAETNRCPLTAFRLAEVYLNPNLKIYDENEANEWVSEAMESGFRTEILVHMSNEMHYLEKKDYFPKRATLYYETLAILAAKFDDPKILQTYLITAKRLAELDPAFALKCYNQIPLDRLDDEDLLERANLASLVIWRQQNKKGKSKDSNALARLLEGLPNWLDAAARLSRPTSDHPTIILVKNLLAQLARLINESEPAESVDRILEEKLFQLSPHICKANPDNQVIYRLLIIPYIKNPTTFYRLGLQAAMHNKNQFNANTIYMWHKGAEMQPNTDGAYLPCLLPVISAGLTPEEEDVSPNSSQPYDALYRSVASIIEKEAYGYLKPLERIHQLPWRYFTLRQQFAALLSEDLIDQSKVRGLLKKVKKIEGLVGEINNLTTLADSLAPHHPSIRKEIAAAEFTENAQLIVFISKINTIKQHDLRLADLQIKINSLPRQYQFIRKQLMAYQADNMNLTDKMIDDLKNQIATFLAFSQKTAIQNNAMKDWLNPLQQFDNNILKIPYRGFNIIIRSEADNYRFNKVNNVFTVLQNKISLHFAQDFSDPKAHTHAQFKAECIELIKQKLEMPDCDLRSASFWHHKLKEWLIHQLHRIFPESPKIKEWVKSSNAYFKVAPEEGKKMRKQVELAFR